MVIRTLSIVCLFSVVTSLCQGQVAQQMTRLTTENGLTQNSIYDIIENTDGFLWIATQDGLNRFDGGVFRTFRAEKGTNRIPDNFVVHLEEDDFGGIWIGTQDWLSRLEKRTLEIQDVQLADTIDGLNGINSLTIDYQLNIRVHTNHGPFSFQTDISEREEFRARHHDSATRYYLGIEQRPNLHQGIHQLDQ